MEERKILGMKPGVAIGLGWLVVVLAIVELIKEKAKLYREEKAQLIQVLVVEVLAYVISFVASFLITLGNTLGIALTLVGLLLYILMIVLGVFAIIAMIKAFCGKYFKIPVVYNIAANFVKSGADDNLAAEEAPAEEAEVVVEAPAEEEK